MSLVLSGRRGGAVARLAALLVLVGTAFAEAASAFSFALEAVDPAYPGNGRPGWSQSADVDGDGLVDVLSGGGNVIQWYRAPSWQRFPLDTLSPEPGSNGGVVYDVDGDGDVDVVTALFRSHLVWWENPGPGPAAQGVWTRHTIDSLTSTFHHDLVRGDFDDDGTDELVSLNLEGDGAYLYRAPADPALSSSWPRTRIVGGIADPNVGLALGDLDDDGDLDVVVSNRWYECPDDPFTDDWTERTVFASAVQNLAVIDVNGDGRLDVVGAEGFVFPNGRILWAEAPADPKTQPWTEHVVATDLDGPENLWAGDLDGDARVDLVSGAMGTSTGFGDSDSSFLVYEAQNAAGTSWTEHVVAMNVGVSARVAPVDIDGDGDIDFTADGNGEDHIYLWRNLGQPPTRSVPAVGAGGLAALLFALSALGVRRLRAREG